MKTYKNIGNISNWKLLEVVILMAILSMYSGLILVVLGKLIF